MLAWAALWKAMPKVVFSTTLSAVQGNARLASGGAGVVFHRRLAGARRPPTSTGWTLARYSSIRPNSAASAASDTPSRRSRPFFG
jgi:hypothetical protein